MQQFDFLSKLMEFEAAGFPFISIYLNTEPNDTGKKDFDVFLKKQLKDHGAVLETGSSEAQSYEADVEKINTFVENLDPTTRGVAIFAVPERMTFSRDSSSRFRSRKMSSTSAKSRTFCRSYDW